MAILASDIIAFARTTSDLKLSRFLLDDPDLLGFLNDLISELYDMFVIDREGYFQSTATLTVTNNAATLPADFYKEISLWSGTATSPCPIDMLDSYEDRFTESGAWISANNVTFYPVSHAVQQPVQLDYIPSCPVLTTATAIPQAMERFAEWLKVGLTIKIKSARNQEYAGFQKTFERLTQRIVKMTKSRRSPTRTPAIPESEKRSVFGLRRVRYPFP